MAGHLSISRLFAALLPHSCLLCGTPTGEALCPACVADLPLPGDPCCPVCAVPLPAPAPLCADCLRAPPAFDFTLAALRYSFPVDRLVQHLKFGGGRAFSRFAGAGFFAARMLAGPHAAGDVIVPVPLSRQRLAARGFNQALEIARPLARALNRPLDAATLLRRRDTAPQSRLPWRTRQGNVRHAFECCGDFSGRTVIVIDDVMTTGATLDAVARTLKAHGATQVVNWVAARAVKQLT